MSEQPLKKRYYRILFKLTSALTIGNGKSERADKDLVLNSLGKPYIPATALAGVYQALYCEADAKKYFGYVEINRSGQQSVKSTESRCIIYDGNLKNNQYRTSVRDGVGLDQWKTAVKRAKFDFEILEPGAVFVTYLEENLYDATFASGLIMDAWKRGEIVLGSKTSRGYGKTEVLSIQQREFDFKVEKDINSWIKFDLFDENCWKNVGQWDYEKEKEQIQKLRKQKDIVTLKLGLKQNSPLTIRKYTTDVSNGKESRTPDYEQLVYIRDKESIPVIPGTSWAGAFRHHMLKLNKECIGSIFGKKASDENEKDGKKSDIIFGESEITGAKAKIVTRNGIDRFTGGAADNTLFTEKMYYGGSTVLKISFKKNCSQDFLRTLAASIADLHLGILSIGGETSVGHGLFQVTSVFIDGKEISRQITEAEQLYGLLVGAFAGGNGK